MPGQLIQIEGRGVTYFAAGEQIGPPDRDVIGFDSAEDRTLQTHSRLRRVFTTMIRPVPRFYGVLHWSDGTDLAQMDRKVREGSVSDQDFGEALLAEPRTIVCGECETQLRCLAVDTGQALFARTLARRLREHQLKTACPVCGEALSVPIVEFLEA